MKKIIPIITLSSFALIMGGCSDPIANTYQDLNNNLTNLKEEISQLSILPASTNFRTNLENYSLNIEDDTSLEKDALQTENLPKTLEYLETDSSSLVENGTDETSNENREQENNETLKSTDQERLDNEKESNLDLETENDHHNVEEISTLYSINKDICSSCEEFDELKEELTETILETQHLIEKIQNKEVELSREQRIFITEQAMQLNNLSNQLKLATDELSLSVSELNSLITNDTNSISLKSLILLNNLLQRNRILYEGLNNLNMMNNAIINPYTNSINGPIRFSYWWQQNNDPAVIKDYFVDENGNISENEIKQETTNSVITSNDTADANKQNIDTYKDRKLKTNIDTYGNFNKKNIDTFFNTALLNNEFMYGNGGMYNGMYPYLAQNNYNNMINNDNNTINRDTQTQTTQDTQPEEIIKNDTKDIKKNTKKIKFKKNIDTFNSSGLNIKTKISAIKNSVSSFFSKLKNKDIEFPIYKETIDE